MRVEIADWMGRPYTISSKNAKLIGDWFAEHAGRLMTADSRLAIQIRIWPDDEDEFKLIGRDQVISFTQDGLLHWAEKILEASKKLGELEEAAAGGR